MDIKMALGVDTFLRGHTVMGHTCCVEHFSAETIFGFDGKILNVLL